MAEEAKSILPVLGVGEQGKVLIEGGQEGGGVAVIGTLPQNANSVISGQRLEVSHIRLQLKELRWVLSRFCGHWVFGFLLRFRGIRLALSCRWALRI